MESDISYAIPRRSTRIRRSRSAGSLCDMDKTTLRLLTRTQTDHATWEIHQLHDLYRNVLTNLPQLPCASLGSLEGTGCCCRINKKRVVENLRHIQCDALVPITNITVFYSTVPYSRRTGTWSWATIGQPGSAASRVEDEVRLTGPLLDHHVASSRLCCFLATGMQTIILAGHPYSCYTPQLVEQQRRLASAPCSLVHIVLYCSQDGAVIGEPKFGHKSAIFLPTPIGGPCGSLYSRSSAKAGFRGIEPFPGSVPPNRSRHGKFGVHWWPVTA